MNKTLISPMRQLSIKPSVAVGKWFCFQPEQEQAETVLTLITAIYPIIFALWMYWKAASAQRNAMKLKQQYDAMGKRKVHRFDDSAQKKLLQAQQHNCAVHRDAQEKLMALESTLLALSTSPSTPSVGQVVCDFHTAIKSSLTDFSEATDAWERACKKESLYSEYRVIERVKAA